MIEKLKRPVKIGGTTFREKINELVDVVNKLQLVEDVMFNRIDILNNAICDIRNRISALDDPTYHEEPANPYAEQRRWIGCLVEYGNADDGFRYGILTNIEPRYSAYPFEIDNGRDATADCWLPSKTIFYKGGNNE